MKTSIAIYPGSFDPVTNGHLDLIERGEKMFDLLIVAMLRNTEKQPLFSVPERVEMLREVTKKWADVEVDVFEGLLVDYARKRGAGVILRGIRAVSDYEYELQMALMNRKLEPRLETVFMLPGEPYSYLSSKLVREIARHGGPLNGLVPPIVEQRLRAKVSKRCAYWQALSRPNNGLARIYLAGVTLRCKVACTASQLAADLSRLCDAKSRTRPSRWRHSLHGDQANSVFASSGPACKLVT